MTYDDFNDDLSDLIGSPMKPVPVTPPANYVQKDHIETCPKCRGTGRFTSYSGRVLGQCFTCKGAGKRTFKSSAADREKARDQRADRATAKRVGNLAAFKAEHPAEHAWLEGAAGKGNEFAMSLLGAIEKFGALTEKQLAAVTNKLARIAERKAEDAARIANAPEADTAGVDRLMAAFDKAVAFAQAKGNGNTIRTPKITVRDMIIYPAKATSKNPGALYVKGTTLERNWQSGEMEQAYLGKIQGGKFFASRACTPEQQTEVLKFLADPKAAAEAYGQETGTCCICNATLRSEWRLRGIGPICAQKFGF